MGRAGAEKNPRKRDTFQVEAAEFKGETPNGDKAEVLATVSETV